ncbi:MAG: AraC family transcriptional regulator [Clostridium sp.]|nr:AraC family transcriptional regulator [Clostridium sp.]
MSGICSKYFAITPRDNDWGIAVTTAGHQVVEPGGEYPLGSHPELYRFSPAAGRVLDEYQLVYITGGGGWFTSRQGKKTRIVPGSMIMLFPGEWHSYSPDPELGWEEYWIGMRGPHFDRRIGMNFFSTDSPVSHIGVSSTMVDLYERLIRVGDEEKPGYQQLMSGMALHLLGLTYYKQLNNVLNDPAEADIVTRAKLMMRDTMDSSMTAEDIAESLGVGYSRFRKMFRLYTGVAPAQYWLQLKIVRAKELLTSSPSSVSEIAYQLGYENTAQFSTCFRKKTGITPSEFRRRQMG